MDSLPNVTVIIPCYNHARTVVEAIDSVVSQDYANKQICIINPGSTDDSDDVITDIIENAENKEVLSDHNIPLQHYIEGDIKGVKTYYLDLFKAKVQGPSAARNKCIKFMWDKTHLFSMLDADDYYKPGKISKCVSKMMEDPSRIGIVYNDLEIYHENNGLRIREFRPSYSRVVLERENIITNTPLISKLALSNSGLYDEELRVCEDWDLWLRITEHCFAVHISEALSVYRVTGNNTTQTVHSDIWNKSWSIVQEKMRIRNGC